MKINFQQDYDTLTITFSTSRNTVCLEQDGVLYRVDPDKKILLGITIEGFAYRSEKHGGFNLSSFLSMHQTEKLEALFQSA